VSQTLEASQVPQAAAIYLRISDDKAGEALGVERQEKECRAKAAARGWVVAEVYNDPDTSASKAKVRRPHYERMMADIKAGRRDGIVVWDFDRTNRQLRDLADIIDLRVSVISVTGTDIDLATVPGRLVATILGGVARQQVEHMSENLVAEIKQKAFAGKPTGHRRSFGWTDSKLQTLHPVEAPAIREATAALLAGASLRGLVTQWNRAGLTTSMGKAWQPITLKQMIMRWSNVAVPVYRDEPLLDVPGLWKPIVDREDFDAVRAILSNNSPSARAPRKYMLSNVLVCEKCGSRMRGGSGRYNCVNEIKGLCSLTILPIIADEIVSSYVVNRLTTLSGRKLDPSTVVHRRSYIETALKNCQASRVKIAESGLDLSSRIALLKKVDGEEKALRAESTARSSSKALVDVIAKLLAVTETEDPYTYPDVEEASMRRPDIETALNTPGGADIDLPGGKKMDLDQIVKNRKVLRTEFELLDLAQRRMLARAFGEYTVAPFKRRGADRVTIEPLYPDLRILAA
jgi:DNA invertase Pin-like site-specific DNA recombinase